VGLLHERQVIHSVNFTSGDPAVTVGVGLVGGFRVMDVVGWWWKSIMIPFRHHPTLTPLGHNQYS